jgi:hypothetical protein
MYGDREPGFPVITICGSMRYFAEMLTHARLMTRQGYIVLMPFDGVYAGGMPGDSVKEMLDRMHLAKIDMSAEVHVIGSHIGESTSAEIKYTESRSIPIRYFEYIS